MPQQLAECLMWKSSRKKAVSTGHNRPTEPIRGAGTMLAKDSTTAKREEMGVDDPYIQRTAISLISKIRM